MTFSQSSLGRTALIFRASTPSLCNSSFAFAASSDAMNARGSTKVKRIFFAVSGRSSGWQRARPSTCRDESSRADHSRYQHGPLEPPDTAIIRQSNRREVVGPTGPIWLRHPPEANANQAALRPDIAEQGFHYRTSYPRTLGRTSAPSHLRTSAPFSVSHCRASAPAQYLRNTRVKETRRSMATGSFVLLFVVATAVAIAARRLRLPYTVALVLAGLVLGLVRLFEPPNLTKELLYAVFLPGLLFEAAFHLEFRDFWRDRFAIAALAVPGVVAAVALTAMLLEPGDPGRSDWDRDLAGGTPWCSERSSPPPTRLRSSGCSRALGRLAGCASCSRARACSTTAPQSSSSRWRSTWCRATQMSASGMVVEFARVVGGGLAIGVLVGLAISQVIRQIDDPMIEITLTTLNAYGSFLAAEHLGFSGVIATVSAGMLCGNYAARTGMSPSTRIAAETFWEYIAFALNSIVFLLVGLHVHVRELANSWQLVIVAYGGGHAGPGRRRLCRPGARARRGGARPGRRHGAP